MIFTKKDNMYRISRITGSQENILGVCFTENDEKNNENNIEVIEWPIKEGAQIGTSRDQVVKV